MRLILLSLFLSTVFFSTAQNGRYLDREIQIEADNDAFTGNLYLDQYYSQGSYGKYRVLDTLRTKKLIKSIGLNHRIYTPSNVSLTDVEQFDRPYAGHLTISGSLAFFDEKSATFYGLELGTMGKSSLAQPIQEGWHKTFGFGAPEGWKYQINDSPIINGQFQYARVLAGGKHIQLLSESNLAAGTAFTNVRQEVMLRVGKFFSVKESVLYGSNVGHKKFKSEVTRESILFVAFGPEYVFYNSTIEGNLIGEESVHTEEIIPWVRQWRVGAMFAWSSFDFSMIAYFRSAENTKANVHRYVGFRFSQRF